MVSGDTPLHKAVKNGHTQVAELLLSRGANVNKLNVSSYMDMEIYLSMIDFIESNPKQPSCKK